MDPVTEPTPKPEVPPQEPHVEEEKKKEPVEETPEDEGKEPKEEGTEEEEQEEEEEEQEEEKKEEEIPKEDAVPMSYVELCERNSVTPNSYLLQLFETHELHEIDVVDLSHNYIGDRGVLPLLEILGQCQKLKKLILKENGLRNNAAIAIAHAFLDHPSLTSIDLSGNQISATGGKALLELLQTNRSIKELDFTKNRIDVQIRLKLTSELETSRRME
eukprot:TRINITY_DN6360_c0_g1_i1.p1 TRINITY_DN6360_c0_g1~~TRINITY_DN6360_c0_g1_i1.p1  ORF type:complete len:217 (+),score=86.11 TRINITY_DN6360_c0_g1_i1:142-792(+)